VVLDAHRRKAADVKAARAGDVTPMVPASIPRTHGRTTMYLDVGSASALAPATLARYQL